jgi:hypothetical protein
MGKVAGQFAILLNVSKVLSANEFSALVYIADIPH